ncbi:MAG: ribonuclease P protein component [Planctomycetaceae bacterium]|nr:MAG: ribonuclease P protein component [Planctomycetaceae bacterium]
MSENAGKSLRLVRKNDIDRLFADGRRKADAFVTLFGLPNGMEDSRVGVGVSTRHGNAVKRNRIKRLCREAFRLSRAQLPQGWDYMIIPRAGIALTLPMLRGSLLGLSTKLVKEFESRSNQPAKPTNQPPSAEPTKSGE